LSTQNRRDCRLGRKRRLVLLLACETLLPTIGPLPVTWQTRAMDTPLGLFWPCVGEGIATGEGTHPVRVSRVSRLASLAGRGRGRRCKNWDVCLYPAAAIPHARRVSRKCRSQSIAT